MNQSFKTPQLISLCKKEEYINYGISLEDFKIELDSQYEQIIEESFEFSITNTGDFFLTEQLKDKLILRKLNDNIKRIYKDEQANRRIIISQIITLLSETCPHWVIKTDIKSFFESINTEKLIQKFQDDSILSYQSMFLLKKIFSNSTLIHSTGLPRGMNISSTLSEIYMRKFDKWVRRFDGVYYYARFVDDIIIFSHNLKDAIKLIGELNKNLSDLAFGLEINESKTELFEGNFLKLLDKNTGEKISNGKDLEYLGYLFRKVDENKREAKFQKFNKIEKLRYTIDDRQSEIINENISYIQFNSINEKPKPTLKVSIAKKKVTKIKTRIIKTFLDFGKNKNFELLKKRIKFLTGNYSIRKTIEGNDLRAGIYYNYTNINDLSIFIDLNTFYTRTLYSKNSFGAKVGLSISQKKELKKFCFYSGFKNKVYHPFTYIEMEEIIKCW